MSNKMPKPAPRPEEFRRVVFYPVNVAVSRVIVPYKGHFDKGTYRKSYGTHTGLDYIGTAKDRGLGDPVYAIADGVVTNSSPTLSAFGYGNMIVINHPQFQGQTHSRYAHLQKRVVKLGARVRAGDIIGYMGTSGTDNVHLHFDIFDKQLPNARYFPKGGFTSDQVDEFFRDPVEFFRTTNAQSVGDA
jgi:murein DD-endopeptidase MepM/ murein hydrolase activator NlpD